MDKKEDFEKYESNIIDIDEVEGTDIKINPSFYIHMALISCQKALEEENVSLGDRISNYLFRVSHLQSVCKSAKLIPPEDTYFKDIKDFENNEEYKAEKDSRVKTFQMARKKYELLTERVFDSKLMTNPLKLK